MNPLHLLLSPLYGPTTAPRKPAGGHRAPGYKRTEEDIYLLQVAEDRRQRRGAKLRRDYDRCIANNPCLPPQNWDDDDDPLRCWCGAEGSYEELHDNKYLDSRCGGSGILYCHCGGDFCVCHNHGEVDCYGCRDCEGDYDDDDDYWEDDAA